MAATTARCVSRIEVESKFMPTTLLRSHLDRITSSEARKQPTQLIHDGLTVRGQTVQYFHDTYYDVDDKLSSSGIWVRRRAMQTLQRLGGLPVAMLPDVHWEAKIRLGGCFNKSLFEEVEGRRKIATLLQDRYSLALENLKVTADLVTERSAFAVHNLNIDKACPGTNMHLVLDRVVDTEPVNMVWGPNDPGMEGFTHEIGEVELVNELVLDTEEEKQQVSKQMRKFLDEFMLRQKDLFSTNPKPVGKLSAYFAWKQRQGE